MITENTDCLEEEKKYKKSALIEATENLTARIQQLSDDAIQSDDFTVLEKTLNRFHQIDAQIKAEVKLNRINNDGIQIPSLEGVQYHALLSSMEADREKADDLLTMLEEYGFRIFSTDRDILSNERHVTALCRAMTVSRKFVMFVTKSYLNSLYFDFELAQAITDMIHRREVSMIPILSGVSEESIPACITSAQSINTDQDGWIQQLIQCLCDNSPLDSLIPAGDVAYGLAWSYYYGYLRIILPSLRTRAIDVENSDKFAEVRKKKNIPSNIPFLKKFICVLSVTSFCPTTFDREDSNIETVHFVDFEENVSGNVKRNYKTCIHHIKHPHDPKKQFFFMGEFCTPLGSMFKMEAGKISGFSCAERQKQTIIFHKKLKEIMHHPKAEDCIMNFVHLPYRDADLGPNGRIAKDNLSLLLCQTIERELHLETEIERGHRSRSLVNGAGSS